MRAARRETPLDRRLKQYCRKKEKEAFVGDGFFPVKVRSFSRHYIYRP
jgi:hypothetical protein